MIFLTIHKISFFKVRVSMGSVETRWLGSSFFMVYRNNAGRLDSGFISVCLETRWLGQKAVSMCRNDLIHIYTHAHVIRMHMHTYAQIENHSNDASTCQAIS